MSTHCAIIVKVSPDELGREIKYIKSRLPEGIVQDYFKGGKGPDISEPVTINHEYIGIYCHWDGYPSGVGKVLSDKFKTKEETLNLIAGGDCSAILGTSVTRYATRGGEQWEYIVPKQNDDLDALLKVYDGCDYYYLLDEGKWLTGKLV